MAENDCRCILSVDHHLPFTAPAGDRYRGLETMQIRALTQYFDQYGAFNLKSEIISGKTSFLTMTLVDGCKIAPEELRRRGGCSARAGIGSQRMRSAGIESGRLGPAKEKSMVKRALWMKRATQNARVDRRRKSVVKSLVIVNGKIGRKEKGGWEKERLGRWARYLGRGGVGEHRRCAWGAQGLGDGRFDVSGMPWTAPPPAQTNASRGAGGAGGATLCYNINVRSWAG
ncbi:hypothetical protein B0H19DRAFT_1080412 [Mycena capillaripes]|nr:hypothetical protein B0H19DRAFT_1080412 [Mycena capillaripes]